MLIGLDIRSVYSPDSFYRGIGEYGRNLLRHLLSQDELHEYILFSNKAFLPSDLDLSARVGILHLKRMRRLLWVQDQIFLPLEILFKKIDLFHSLNLNLPVFKTTKTIASVPDVIPLIYPRQYLVTKSVKLWYGLQLKFLHQADRIIVNSHYTKQDLVRLAGIPEGKVKVIYYGLNPVYRSAADMNHWPQLQDKFNIRKKYILYVGGFDRRKNIPFLISVFKTVKENMDISLVLAGADGSQGNYLLRLAQECGLAGDVIFTGFVDLKDLRMLYGNAEVFAFPSLYEGFGLPLIEAMASGCPLVAIDSSATPEITQDAALLVEAGNKEVFARSLIRVIQDKDLRASLVDKGLRRAEDFSWGRAVEETIATYREVLNE